MRDQVFVFQIGDLNGFAPGQTVQARNRQMVFVAAQIGKVQIRIQSRIVHHHKRLGNAVAAQHFDQRDGAFLLQVNVQAGIQAVKAGQHFAEMNGFQAADGANGKRAAHQPAIGRHILAQQTDVAQNIPGAFYKFLTGLGKMHRARGAVKKGHAQFFFQLGHLQRKGGLRKIQLLGGAGKTVAFGNGQNGPQLGYFHKRVLLS